MSLIPTTRSAKQHIGNIRIGKPKPELAKVEHIGVFKDNGDLLITLNFTESTVRNICALNPELSPLKVTINLATGVRIVGVYADSTAGIRRRSVIFRGIK